jgi:hypothetical protein
MSHQPFIQAIFCLYLNFDPVYAARMVQMQGLVDWWKELVVEKQARLGDHWTETMKL